MKKVYGFTLAEVLITLGIIGIVAAMTIPTLIANYQKTQYVVGLKKFYSIWSQALIQMSEDAGCMGDLSCFFDSDDANVMGEKIAPYFKAIKRCEYGQITCFHKMDEYLGPKTSSVTPSMGYSFVSADGMIISLDYRFNKNCHNDSYIVPTKKGSAYMCSGFYNFVDVNGYKGPNIIGRDIFAFMIVNKDGLMLIPLFSYADINTLRTQCNENNESSWMNSYYCFALIMEDNWQMNY